MPSSLKTNNQAPAQAREGPQHLTEGPQHLTVRARLPSCRKAFSQAAASAAEVRLTELRLPKRLLQLCTLLLAAFTMLGAGSPANRFDKLGHSLMCTCGCGEILLECNHVGCPVSGPMIAELKTQLATSLPNPGILNWFASKYGPIVLAAPIRGGFDLVAWIVPFAVLLIGILGVVWLVRHWRERHALTLAPEGSAPAYIPTDGLRDRIRRETTFEP